MPRGNERLKQEHESYADNFGAAVESDAQKRIRFANLLKEANEAFFLGNAPKARMVMAVAVGMLKDD